MSFVETPIAKADVTDSQQQREANEQLLDDVETEGVEKTGETGAAERQQGQKALTVEAPPEQEWVGLMIEQLNAGP